MLTRRPHPPALHDRRRASLFPKNLVLLCLPLSFTMLFILAFLFLARRYGTSAAPVAPIFAEPLAYDAPIFTRDECPACLCPGRSVWDIVWSCLATTFAVTWVSVHPNVPWLEEKSWPLLKRRIFLMCLALLAPEVMIMWAFKQWRGALMIRETINKARPESCGVQWTMTHAHFLQMGGFKVNHMMDDNVRSSIRYWYETKKEGILVQECVLNSYRLRGLLEKQLIDFPDTTAKEIEDRSKGDALSKGVALLQITWFIIQLIARSHQHLTITEIELTTAALAGLNSIMYLFWWNKPLDVRCPIIIKTKELERQLVNARNGENESQDDGGSGGDTSAKTWTFPEDVERFRLRDCLRDSPAWVALDLAANTLCPETPVWMHSICCRIASIAQSIILALATHLRSLAKWLPKMIQVRVSRRPILRRSGNVVEPEIELQSIISEPEHFQRTELDFCLEAVECICWPCTVVVTKLFYLPYLLMFLPAEKILLPGWHFKREGYSDAKIKIHSKQALQLLFDEGDMRWIMSMIFYSEEAEMRPLLIFSCLAGAAFGSIHCAAWHFDFPSPVEQILWRTGSLSIVGLCLFIITISPVYTRFVYKEWFIAYSNGSPGNNRRTRIKKTVVTPPVIIYTVARLSLLVLALLSLRRLPPSAFDTVVWTKFIPHI